MTRNHFMGSHEKEARKRGCLYPQQWDMEWNPSKHQDMPVLPKRKFSARWHAFRSTSLKTQRPCVFTWASDCCQFFEKGFMLTLMSVSLEVAFQWACQPNTNFKVRSLKILLLLCLPTCFYCSLLSC